MKKAVSSMAYAGTRLKKPRLLSLARADNVSGSCGRDLLIKSNKRAV